MIFSIVIIAFIAYSLLGNNAIATSNKNQEPISERTYPLTQLQQDFKQFQDTIEKKHPKVYTNQEELSKLYKDQYSLLRDNMSELEFYRILSPIMAKVNCGHSNITLSKEYETYIRESGNVIPLDMKVIDDKIYILKDMSGEGIPAGSEILTINGYTSKDIISTFLENLASDGSILSRKYEVINLQFNDLFYTLIDNADKFEITYQEPQELQVNQKTLVAIPVTKIRDRKEELISLNIYMDMNAWAEAPSKEINQNYAVLNVNSFMSNQKLFKKNIDEFFIEVADKKIQNLIVDFRGNWGGAPKGSVLLYSYLLEQPERYFTDDAPIFFFNYKKPIKPAENKFDGNVYFLVNGTCFSTTGHLVSLLKHHNIGTIIGEETGGSFLCSGNARNYTLKNTQLRLYCSQDTYEVVTSGATPGKGVIPDYEVKPTIDDYLTGNDPVKDFAIELISNKNSEAEADNHQNSLYINQTYNFNLLFPESWEGKYYITEVEPTRIDICHINDIEDERIARLFTLHVFSNNHDFEERYNSLQETIPMKKIYEDTDLIVAVTYPSDIAYVHSEQKYLEEYNGMLGDIPEILSSIQRSF